MSGWERGRIPVDLERRGDEGEFFNRNLESNYLDLELQSRKNQTQMVHVSNSSKDEADQIFRGTLRGLGFSDIKPRDDLGKHSASPRQHSRDASLSHSLRSSIAARNSFGFASNYRPRHVDETWGAGESRHREEEMNIPIDIGVLRVLLRAASILVIEVGSFFPVFF